MKTKKVIVGAVSAAILSLNVCAIPAAFAAGETVQISVSDTKAEAGGTFSVEVLMSDIPSAGVQGLDFTVKYDKSVVTVTKVTEGALSTKTGAAAADESSSIVPIFDSEIIGDSGLVNITWSTLLDDSKYWLQGSGVLCTIEGTIAAGAKDGTTELELVPTDRETYPGSGVKADSIYAGYTSANGATLYTVKPDAGTITIGSAGATLLGDADLDGQITINDVVVIMTAVSSNVPLTGQAAINADVQNIGDGVSGSDAVAVQQYLAKIISGFGN
ncbi:MAG: cohesin domain-containing protein [Ruminococcus sp.]